MKSKALAFILLLCATSLCAKVKLPALMGDNMILQQQTDVKLWGTAAPNAELRITPSWSGQTTTLRNILIGEVWLASGQSNMEMPLKGFAGCCTPCSAPC